VDLATAQQRLLDAADALFYERGVQAVGMDVIREVSGVSLKRLYQAFPSKNDLVDAVLRRRDADVRAGVERYTAAATTADGRILAVFAYLDDWFRQPDFRGCAFINSYAELGPTSESVADVVRSHKRALREHLTGVITEAGYPDSLADQLLILANGAMVTAAIAGSPDPARQARSAARTLLDAASRQPAGLGHSTPT
jgi:AcrR family transcriptional regulator